MDQSYDPRENDAPPPYGEEPPRRPPTGGSAVVPPKAALQAAYAAGFDGVEEARRLLPGTDGYPAEIVTAICRVMSQVRQVEKDGFNKFHQFAYTTMGTLLASIEPAMADAGLVVMPNEVRRVFLANDTVLAVTYEFVLAHASGKVWPIATVMTGIARCRDNKGGFDDKAANKCHTGARKYFLLGLFQTATGDMVDADSEEVARDERGGRAVPQVTHQPAQRAPARQAQPERAQPERAQLPRQEPVDAETQVRQNKCRALVRQAKDARLPEDGEKLLAAWMDVAADMETFRTSKATWDALVAGMSGGLKVSLGDVPAEMWALPLLASNEMQMTQLDARWDGDWSDVVAWLHEKHPAALVNLTDHMNAQTARVRGDVA